MGLENEGWKNEWQKEERDRKCTNSVNIEARLCNHCCSGKVKSNAYFECVTVGLCIQHAVAYRGGWGGGGVGWGFTPPPLNLEGPPK